MGLCYSVKRSSVTFNTAADLLTFIGSAGRSYRILQVEVGGMASASAPNELGIYRVSVAGTTGSGALTPTPANPALPAPQLVVNTAWVAQPTLGALVKTMTCNANGVVNRWTGIPSKTEIDCPGGNNAAASLSFRPISGTSALTVEVWFEEF